MKLVQTKDAVGHVLCHDLTQIIPGVCKDAAFRKGHVVTKEDIPVLLSMGKEHLYIWEKKENMLHENDGAHILCDLCKNEHMRQSEVKEGKIELFAECDGLFLVDKKRLDQINGLGEMIIASRHGDFPVRKGDKLAGMRVIPLLIEEEKMNRAKEAAKGGTLFTLKPFLKMSAGIVTTGSEVFYGRIPDAFTGVVEEKLSEYGVEIVGKELSDDDPKRTAEAIFRLLQKGAGLIVCTGGMSVDPDDRTPAAIRMAAHEVVTYGVPALPGAMFMLAYAKNKVPIMGLPGCVMYAKRTIFDLVLPRVLAGERPARESLLKMGEGGLCLSCPSCVFPNCGFGK